MARAKIMNETTELRKNIASRYQHSSFTVGRPEESRDEIAFIRKFDDSDRSYKNFDVLKEFFLVWNNEIEGKDEFNNISIDKFEIEGPIDINFNADPIDCCFLIKIKVSLLSDKAISLLKDI